MLREIRDSYIGKFDSPMACYVYERLLLNGDFGDDEWSDGDGEWMNRYGRRVLFGDNRGFVGLSTFPTEAEAEAAFAADVAEYDAQQLAHELNAYRSGYLTRDELSDEALAVVSGVDDD